jgi:hypothetical protein
MKGSSRRVSRARSIVCPRSARSGAAVLPGRGATLAGERDGCFEEPGGVARSKRLARWEDPRDRLDYYRGRRAGQESGEEGCGQRMKLSRSLEGGL